MYTNTEAKLSRTVSISNEARDAVASMAKLWDTDLDHAADRMLIVSAGRLRALATYNKKVKKEVKEKAAKKASKKTAKKAEEKAS